MKSLTSGTWVNNCSVMRKNEEIQTRAAPEEGKIVPRGDPAEVSKMGLLTKHSGVPDMGANGTHNRNVRCILILSNNLSHHFCVNLQFVQSFWDRFYHIFLDTWTCSDIFLKRADLDKCAPHLHMNTV